MLIKIALRKNEIIPSFTPINIIKIGDTLSSFLSITCTPNLPFVQVQKELEEKNSQEVIIVNPATKLKKP